MARREFNRQRLLRFLKDTDHTVGIEVGVDKAECPALLLRELPNLYMYLVDDWYSELTLNAALENLSPFKGRYRIVRIDALIAAYVLKDAIAPQDFIYLDVTHNTQELDLYVKKYASLLRSGGHLLGSGFTKFRVRNIVEANYGIDGNIGDLWWWQK